jgi:hypothetical protein
MGDDMMDDALSIFSPERREFIMCCLKIMSVLTDSASNFIEQQKKLMSAWRAAAQSAS